ncbi:MAG: DEAD/DEAH box helicase [Candidatus Tectimicrobiota bacterium]
MSFTSFNLHPRLMSAVQALGYQEPTPIQQQAIPPVLQGRDVMGLAQTGTGKTAAFALPIAQRLMLRRAPGLRALVLAPTRELAEQIYGVFTTLGTPTGLRSVTLYGGVSMQPQIQALRQGAAVAVACPGRLLDHIRQGTIDLRGLEVLVLDEADHLFDMGFIPDIRRILQHLPSQRQTLLFAATMPDEVRHLAEEALSDPVTVQIGPLQPAPTVSHALCTVAPQQKTALLLDLLHQTAPSSVLVFTRTKHRAKRLAQQLAAAGYEATSLQGNLSQRQRQEALDGFRDGMFQILVATDIAARGIDVARISHVINYDIPDTAAAYTHRIGRAGRAMRTGQAFTFVTYEDSAMLRTIERDLGRSLEHHVLPGGEAPAPLRPAALTMRAPLRFRGTPRAKPR